MQALRLDHLVLAHSDIDATERWYGEALGLERVAFDQGRRALRSIDVRDPDRNPIEIASEVAA
jgi:catechol 2,3-dioxygenase-like lactoylglutathione lyase family enzyme